MEVRITANPAIVRERMSPSTMRSRCRRRIATRNARLWDSALRQSSETALLLDFRPCVGDLVAIDLAVGPVAQELLVVLASSVAIAATAGDLAEIVQATNQLDWAEHPVRRLNDLLESAVGVRVVMRGQIGLSEVIPDRHLSGDVAGGS